jgi:multiple sugar transport system substrate-binding protein
MPRLAAAPAGVLVLALACLLAGCGGGAGGAGGTGRVTVRMWAMGREGEVVQELVPEFERLHPGIHVVVQQIPWSAAHEKLLTAHVGGSTPDLAQLGNTWVPEFAALRALEPVDPWLARSPDVPREAYSAGIWDTNVLDGVTYGVPWYVDTRVLFYRRDLLAQAGYDSIPQDWAGWRRAMVALRDQGRRSGGGAGTNARTAIFLPTNEYTQAVLFGLQARSPLLADHETRGAFEDSAFRAAFDFYLGLFRDGLAPTMSGTEIANLYQEFERGTFAMYITGPWNLGEFARRLPPGMQDAWMTAPLPGPTGAASGVSLAGGSSLVLFARSPRKEAAWTFVRFLSDPAVQGRFYRMTGSLPARREAWADSALAADPKIQAFRVQLDRVVASPKVPEWELIGTRVMEWSEKAIRGAMPPDSALAALDRDVDRILEKRRWLLARRGVGGAAGAGAGAHGGAGAP